MSASEDLGIHSVRQSWNHPLCTLRGDCGLCHFSYAPGIVTGDSLGLTEKSSNQVGYILSSWNLSTYPTGPVVKFASCLGGRGLSHSLEMIVSQSAFYCTSCSRVLKWDVQCRQLGGKGAYVHFLSTPRRC